jgi:CubicO group peptidase (beta-lactamase class C family)
VGVEETGRTPITRAYGAADLEHAAPMTAATPTEAGSVSKQFTAAAILLLAQRGKLRLDDDVRAYIPELPDYGAEIRISDLLSHTSGLRDWGSVEDLAGWPRGDRVYTLKDVLSITRRQQRLNYQPGTAWSYTNTGYNLLAIIVERVSGAPLARFTQTEMFQPLGMSHTQWRDDFRRVVPGRAIAYRKTADGYQQLMPFENAYGNGGLITTVGDLLIWNRALSENRLGSAVSAGLQATAVLKDGRRLTYARGLFVDVYRGVPEISHPGSTAGYQAWLGRYPRNGLSIAVLCNTTVNATDLAHRVADLYLTAAAPVAPVSTSRPSPRLAGWYVNDRDQSALHLVDHNGRLEDERGAPVALAADGDLLIGGRRLTPRANDRLEFSNQGDTIIYRLMRSYAPTPAELSEVVGHYRSADAAASYTVSRTGETLLLAIDDRPDLSFRLTPAYTDAFTYAKGVVRLQRDGAGQVVGLRLSNDRVWDLPMQRLP